MRFGVSTLSLFALLFSSIAFAAVPEEIAARLDRDLTPFGAERAGNADGTIPEWTGGLQTPPPGYEPGMHHIDPFADESPLFTITSANRAQYEARLTGVSQAMFNAWPETYEMNVYPSHRTCAVPDWVYASIRNNARTGQLETDGNGVLNAIHGQPFPIPSNGLEMIWNHMLDYLPNKITRQFAAVIPTRSGDFTPYIAQDDAIINWTNPDFTSAEDLNNISALYILHTIAPSRVAGNVILVHESLNMRNGSRQAWQYSPGTRRVRRAPDIAYDNPGTNSDGMSTADSFGGFNGAPDRYDWRVVRKMEAYIPYNNYRLGSPDLEYSDIIQMPHINPDLVRHELHRVWVLEATLRPNTRHTYARRVFYIDEDTTGIVQAEIYDSRGELWRLQEGYPTVAYEVPACVGVAGISYDLNNGRYIIGGLLNQEGPIDFFADDLDDDRYTPSAIRRIGTR
jgi:hypothetical protein